MPDVIHAINSSEELNFASCRLKEVARQSELPAEALLGTLEAWAAALDCPEVREIPGAAFLRLWLRRNTLEAILVREFGQASRHDEWLEYAHVRQRAYPVGMVAHWPAGNIEIQPILSLTCALLGGNTSLVRVPSGLIEPTRILVRKLHQVDRAGLLSKRIFMASFSHSRIDLHEAMARLADAAMIWGGAEALRQLRSLPFPHWARVIAFGPRLSVAALDAATWTDRNERHSWCRRIARDVWQFDQQACSSPQALFLERDETGSDPAEFVEELKYAFLLENSIHPRRNSEPALTSAICTARASWLMDDVDNCAFFPESADWSILLGKGTEIPEPTQGRTLTVLVADELSEVVSRFDRTVQTLGLAIKDPAKEEALADAAVRHGVDRVVRLGQMHAFGSPWDGTDLVRPMVRLVHHSRSHDLLRTNP
jgi:hypothetical protein